MEHINIDKTVEYFKNGIKKDDLKTGFEAEHFICSDDGNSADYNTVCFIAKQLQKDIKNSKDILYNGKYSGFECENYSISFEPSCQFEISIAPQKDIFKLFDIYSDFFEKLNAITKKLNLKIYSVGYHPFKCASELKLNSKERYKYMDKYFKTSGTTGKNMMRATCSTQVAIDYTSENDFIKKYRLASVMSPLISLMCDNSPVFEADKNTMYAVRKYIWNNVDKKRCGTIDELFNKDFGFKKYAEYIYNTPVILDERDGKNVYTQNSTYAQIYKDKQITKQQTEHLLSMFFFDVRLKNYIEIRMADCMPKEYIFAYVAFINTVFYGGDGKCADLIYNNFLNVNETDIEKAKQQILKYGFNANVYGKTAYDILCAVFDTVFLYAGKKTADIIKPLYNAVKLKKTIKEIR